MTHDMVVYPRSLRLKTPYTPTSPQEERVRIRSMNSLERLNGDIQRHLLVTAILKSV